MVLSSADIFFQNQFLVAVVFSKKIGNISRVSSSLDPDHAGLFAKVISRGQLVSKEFMTTIQAN